MQKNITVNLIPGYSVPTILRLSQFDFGYTVTADIFNGPTLYEIPTGQSVTVEGRKPDNNGYQYNAEYSGHTVTFTVEEQMTIVAGDNIVEIVFYSDGVRVGTANFILAIEPAPLNDSVKPSETSLPMIQEAVRAAANAAASAEQAAASVTEAEEVGEDAEAWAVGQRNGVDVGPSDETYHNNAKWYSEQSGQAVAGVRTWNGMSGDVTYTAPVQSVNGQTGDVTIEAGGKCHIVTFDSFDSLPQTKEDEEITDAMVVVNSVLSNPSAQTSDWNVDTNTAGRVTVGQGGTISGSTSLTLYLMESE